MHGLEMHLMFCYNEFWIYIFIYVHVLKAFCRLIEVGLYTMASKKENVNFKLLSLNVRGIRSLEKRKESFDYLIE